jgi:bifunctional oligoribonuclease and PAP phosphatase NrnA
MIYSFTDIQINRAFYLIKKCRNILLVAHIKPDSDTIGSVLALKEALSNTGKNIVCFCNDKIPARFDFLPEAENIAGPDKILKGIKNYDLIITLDCANITLAGISNLPLQHKVPIINIDHHQDSSYFGRINIIKANASSTAEIIYDFLEKTKLPISKNSATCLLTGIFGDTDSFKNPNTTDKTLIITSNLLNLGANLKQITKFTFQDKSLSTLKLWGEVLARIRKHEKLNMISTVATIEDLKKNKSLYEDLEGIANFLNSIPEAKASMVLTEREGEIKGSLRTLKKGVDISKLAHILGGGGHKKAAGFTIPGKIVKNSNGKWEIL